ncbi:MAG: hypothetical protein KDB80_16225 [Planctomycetes bacterium]|nr:hypothetical protein [Planctomycetota bacterium]
MTHARPFALAVLLVLPGCVSHLLSRSNRMPRDDRPVVRIETRGGVEYGAATDHGLLMLGRTATEGPCRVHYFLGDQLFVEDGVVEPAGGLFYRAEIDLKHQYAHFLGRDVTEQDELVAITFDGDSTSDVPLQLVREGGVSGDVARHPGVDLDAGTPVFVRSSEGDLLFVGLVAAEASRSGEARTERYVVFTGADRLREMMLVPQRDPQPRKAKHRADGISVVK